MDKKIKIEGMNFSPAMEVFRIAWGKGLNAKLQVYEYKGEIQIYFQIVGSSAPCYDYATSIKAIEAAIAE